MLPRRRSRTAGLIEALAGLFGAFAAGDFGIGSERPIDFDSIALLQGVIRPGQSAEDAEWRVREIHADEIRVESGQAQGVGYAGTRWEGQGLDYDALRLCRVGDLDLERCVAQWLTWIDCPRPQHEGIDDGAAHRLEHGVERGR